MITVHFGMQCGFPSMSESGTQFGTIRYSPFADSQTVLHAQHTNIAIHSAAWGHFTTPTLAHVTPHYLATPMRVGKRLLVGVVDLAIIIISFLIILLISCYTACWNHVTTCLYTTY